MSFDGMSGLNTPISDRMMSLMLESQKPENRNLWVRTLYLPKKTGTESVYRVLHMDMIKRIVSPFLRESIDAYQEILKDTLTSTSSHEGWGLDKLTQTTHRQIMEQEPVEKKGKPKGNLFG